MKKQATTLLLTLLVSYFTFAQNSKKADHIIAVEKTKPNDSVKVAHIQDISSLNDSLKVAHYYKLFKVKLEKDPKAAKVFLDSIVHIANDAKDIYLDERMFHALGFYYTVTRDSKKTEEALEKLIQVRKQLNDTLGLKQAYVNISKMQLTLGKHDLASESLYTALRLSEEMGFTPEEKISVYFKLVQLHGKMGNIEKSNYYNGLVEKAVMDSEDKNLLPVVWNNYAVNYRKIEDYPNALIYFKKTISHYEFDDKYTTRLPKAYNNIGIVYIKTDSLKLAKQYFIKAEQLALGFNNKRERNVSVTHLGIVYQKLGEFNKAITYLERSKNEALKTGYTSVLNTSYYALSEVYAKVENYKKAYENRVFYSDLIYETKNQETIDKINELELKYETEKKEQQLIIQKNEIDLLNIKSKVNNQQRLLLGLGLLLALMGLYAFFQRSKRHRLEKEKALADLEFKTKELTTHALHLAKKNEVLTDLKEKAKALKAGTNSDPGYQMLIQTINFDLQDDNNWENFSRYFEEVHKNFNTNAQQKFPKVTPNDLRLMSLIKMNLSSKEIANILNISSDGIKKARQRLRKKMGIESNDSLEASVIAI